MLPWLIVSSDRCIWRIPSAMRGESGLTSSRIARISTASSIRPFFTSHLGDSGKKGIVESMRKLKRSGIAKGKRHEKLVLSKKHPRSMNWKATRPRDGNVPSRTTNRPRCVASEDSACQAGTVATLYGMLDSSPRRNCCTGDLHGSKTKSEDDTANNQLSKGEA